MKKYNKYFVVSLLVVFSLVMIDVANAASTIGTNMSTTGTFTQTVGSATASRFQNAAGTITVLQVDTSNTRVGVGAAPSTTFEVQGTASASYFFTLNTIQVAGVAATVAYSRFGTGTTGNSGQLDAANDLLITGALEVDGKTFLDGTASVASDFEVGGIASISSVLYMTSGQFRPGTGGDATTAFRFQNAAGTSSVLTIDTTNKKVGINKTPATIFDVKGTASAAYGFFDRSLQVAGTTGASVAYSRFGTGTTGNAVQLDAANDLLITGALEVDGKAFLDGTASVASNFEIGGTASVSGVLGLNDGQIRPGANSATAFRFQNAAGTTSVLTIDTTNGRVGVGKTPSTIFDVKGTASAAYGFFDRSLQVAGTTGASVAYSRFGTGTTGNTGEMDAANDLLITGSLEVDGKASVASNFQMSGRFIADTTASHAFTGDLTISRDLMANGASSSFVVGSTTASSSLRYVAEFGGSDTGTVSLLFGGDSSSKGTCLQLKNATGKWVYLRISGIASPSLVINQTKCH